MAEPDKDVYKVLADRHRRRIISALCGGPMVAGELGRLVGLAPNAVSFHLKLLRSAGLVSVRRKGRFLHYEADVGALAGWQTEVQRLFEGRVADHLAEGMANAGRAAAPTPEPQAARGPELHISTADEQSPPPAREDELPTELL